MELPNLRGPLPQNVVKRFPGSLLGIQPLPSDVKLPVHVPRSDPQPTLSIFPQQADVVVAEAVRRSISARVLTVLELLQALFRSANPQPALGACENRLDQDLQRA